jgi:hypothetical protein
MCNVVEAVIIAKTINSNILRLISGTGSEVYVIPPVVGQL